MIARTSPSLDTKNKRDKRLRSRDFFAVEQHPYVRFVSESAGMVRSPSTLVVNARPVRR